MAVLDEDFQRLWSLLAELSAQLTANREQCETLKRQAEQLKDQAKHTGTGYALRRFNVDLSKEVFESELERMNASLVVENQTLQYENRQLSVLLKEYETTLEQVMTRFRSHAHSTQTHEIDLVRHYEAALLSALEGASPANAAGVSESSIATLAINAGDPQVLTSLQNLSTLVQRALRSLSGEDEDSAYCPPDPLATGTSGESLVEGERRSLYSPRVHDPASGGYLGPRGSALTDPALLHAIEVERLRKENEQLRELLGISAEQLPESANAGGQATGSSGLVTAGSGMSISTVGRERTGAGVVVPESLLKSAEQDGLDEADPEPIIQDGV